MNGTVKLVEPGVKYFFNETLKQCKKTKQEYYNLLYNGVLLLLFILCLGGVLYYNYREKEMNEELKEIRNEQKQKYIIELSNKLRRIEEDKTKNINMITGLPNFESEFEITMKKFL